MTTNRPSVQAVLYSREEERFLIIGKKDAFSGLLAWRLVKGGVKKGETDTVALKREIHEEVGLKEVEILDRVYYYEFNYLNQNHQVSVTSSKPTSTKRSNSKAKAQTRHR
jgi:ADP-ribose pyrophosphatase YjhB (NUDIX family)